MVVVFVIVGEDDVVEVGIVPVGVSLGKLAMVGMPRVGMSFDAVMLPVLIHRPATPMISTMINRQPFTDRPWIGRSSSVG